MGTRIGPVGECSWSHSFVFGPVDEPPPKVCPYCPPERKPAKVVPSGSWLRQQEEERRNAAVMD